MSNKDALQKLAEILEQRKDAKADESYVASLYESGLEKILAKIEEEAVETIDAARKADAKHLIHEVADLWFHCMVLLAQQNLSHEDVLEELNQRFGISGLVEKAQR
ncbi:MAG: phosphoribosyl-ATP diphosphatase [Gammaproteobacteria bacterium]|nr:MAG: phosphoribosyl-ATP diphosphatase [Gammaproteobacteria bacterium]